MARKARKEPPRQDTLARLRDLRDALEAQLAEAKPAYVGRIASEYRATVLEIEKMEGGGAGGDPSGSLASVIATLSVGVPKADA